MNDLAVCFTNQMWYPNLWWTQAHTFIWSYKCTTWPNLYKRLSRTACLLHFVAPCTTITMKRFWFWHVDLPRQAAHVPGTRLSVWWPALQQRLEPRSKTRTPGLPLSRQRLPLEQLSRCTPRRHRRRLLLLFVVSVQPKASFSQRAPSKAPAAGLPLTLESLCSLEAPLLLNLALPKSPPAIPERNSHISMLPLTTGPFIRQTWEALIASWLEWLMYCRPDPCETSPHHLLRTCLQCNGTLPTFAHHSTFFMSPFQFMTQDQRLKETYDTNAELLQTRDDLCFSSLEAKPP